MKRQRPVTLPAQRKNVVSYNDDIFAWAYLDQEDGLIRYEAYVIGYSAGGEPTTLEFVIEEGALPWERLPKVEQMWRDAAGEPFTKEQWATLHRIFSAEEATLKRTQRAQWSRRLRALGYDV